MKHRFLYVLFAALACYIILPSRSGGLAAISGQDRTGSPFSAGSCGNCHGGGSFGTVTPTIAVKQQGSGTLVTSYVPGTTYDLEISFTTSSGTPARYGMQSVLLTGSNAQAGSLASASANGRFSTIAGRTYFEQNGSGGNLFSAQWTAPTAGTGNVTVYAAGLAGNGGGTSGDNASAQINLVLTEAAAPFSLTATADTVLAGSNTTITAVGTGGSGASTYHLLDTAFSFIQTNGSGIFSQAYPCGITPAVVIATRGADSDTAYLDILVEENAAVTNSATTICAGDAVSFAGQTYFPGSNTLISDTVRSFSGCDSAIEVLTITVNDTIRAFDTVQICSGGSFFFNGQSLTTAGTYLDTLVTFNNCDSTIELTIVVGPNYDFTLVDDTVCSGSTVQFQGQSVSISADTSLVDTLTSSTNCDSILRANYVTFPSGYTVDIDTSICEGDTLELFGTKYSMTDTGSGIIVPDTDSNGCSFNYSIDISLRDTVLRTFDTIFCVNENVDTIEYLGRKIPMNGSEAFIFTALNGCDSTLIVNVREQICFSIAPIPNNRFQLFPNPAKDVLVLESTESLVQVRIMGMDGRAVLAPQMISNGRNELDVRSLSAGPYLLLLQTEAGTYRHRFVKE